MMRAPNLRPAHQYGVSNTHQQDPSYAPSPSTVTSFDSNAWYAAVNNTYVPDFPPGAMESSQGPYLRGQATTTDQWTRLMSDSGIFEQPVTPRTPGQSDGSQPESVPESINMIY